MVKADTVIDVYLAGWCEPCKRFKKDTWNSLKKIINKDPTKGCKGVTYREHMEGSKGGDAAAAKAGVSKYPTVIVTKNGVPTDISKTRDEQSIRAAIGCPVQAGGGSPDDGYQHKYIKYKSKYLALKQSML